MTARRRKDAPPDEAPPLGVDRPFPHNLEAERSVLGAVIINNAALEQIADGLLPRHFYRDAHRRIYDAMLELVEGRKVAVDFVTLKEELARRGELDEVGGPAYVSSLVDGLPHQTNIRYYSDIVREKALLRDLIIAGNKLVAAAYEATDPAVEILKRADTSLLELQMQTDRRGMQDMRRQAGQLFNDLEARVEKKGQLWGVDTGFKSINDLTLGWQPGDLIVLAARPSIGKTAFVLNTTLAAARQGRHVALFSLEMRRKQLEFRMLSSLAGVPLTKIQTGYLAETEYAHIAQALTVLDDLPIHVNDRGGQTAPDIRLACRRLRNEERLDLVVVDYVQLMPGTLDRRGANRNEEVTDISRRMKSLADECALPVILLSQLNRAAEGRSDPRPKLSDLRESGALEQDADIVAFLHRKNHRESGVTAFIAEKQRNGPAGAVNLTFDRDIQTFTDGGEEKPPTPEEQEREREDRQRRFFKRRAHAR